MTAHQLLRRFMKERGWKVADLSRATGINDAYLSRIVKGTRKAGMIAAHKIADATNGKVPVPSWLER